jgi:SAM-dependent methyltransferase
MADLPARTDVPGVGRRPVFYAGRFASQIAGTDLPSDCIVLGEQDVLPHKLTGALARADSLVLLDLRSFRPEAMTGEHWNIPIVVVLPPDSNAESLTADFGSVLFERLGFFDRVATPDPALWDELRRKYHWAETQHVPVTSYHPGEVAKTLCASSSREPTPSAAARAVGTDHDLRCNKAVHRVQAAALEPRFVAGRGERDHAVPLDVLEVGAGVGRWAASFEPTKTRFVGIEAHEDLVEAARANFPDQRFDRLGSELLFPYEDESFDLVFSVTVMHHNPAPARRTLLSEMWRVARPGGRLLFLEDFVFVGRSDEPAIYPMSVSEFVDVILDATAGQVVLEHAESLRYPGEDLHRGGLISLSRLGVPSKPGSASGGLRP